MKNRIQKLKKSVISKACVTKNQDGVPLELLFRSDVRICVERGRLLTQSYKETEGEPEVIRRAKALAGILENMTLFIQEGELIVGCFSSSPNAVTIYPEINERVMEKGINNGFSGMLDEDGKKELIEICRYWHGKSMDDRVRAVLPEHLKGYVDYNSLNVGNIFSAAIGIPLPDHEKLLRMGLNGILNEINAGLKTLESAELDLHADEYFMQLHTLKAMQISCNAVIGYARRYSQKAEDLARKETDPERREELEKIAVICSRVPANPPETLHEALQSYFFSHLISRMIEFCGEGAGDRLDLIMYPFYKKDLEGGRINRDEARELVECLWIKIDEMGHMVPKEEHGRGGSTLFQNFVLGGVTSDGDDACNDFSLIMIDAAMTVRSPHTNLCLRYHSRINQEVVSKAIDCIRSGLGYPSIFNDACIIPYIVNRGIPIDTARNYTLPACIVWGLPGKCQRVSTSDAGHFSGGKCLELALNQGKDPFSGKELGHPTPDPLTFTDFEDVMQAFLKQVEFVSKKIARIDDIAQAVYSRYMHRPYTSVLIDGCIQKGRDAITWRDAAFPSIIMSGFIDVSDSLAAIKKFVFDDNILSMQEMLETLKNNFEGKEELRQRLINEVPKFGNDDDYADHIAREVHHRSQKVLEKIISYWGVPYSLEGSVAGAYYPWGRRVGAMAGGKKNRETFADGSLSPHSGMDRKGPTAVLSSVGKVTPVFPELLNQRFMPTFLEGENKKIFADYLSTWADLGCWHIQFNVVDDKVLLDAQTHPEKYSDMVVRVAGYSAYFVDLSVGQQDEIIKRVTQTL